MKDVTIPVRLSHLLRDCSVGAIVRGDRHLVVVPDTRRWFPSHAQPESLQYVDQVRNMLGIAESLLPPPIAQMGDSGKVEGTYILAPLFPQWMLCAGCRLLHYQPWRQQKGETTWYCPHRTATQCRLPLAQVPWVMAHAEGYLADAPWHLIAHPSQRQEGAGCRPDGDSPYLRLEDGEDGRLVICSLCGSRGAMPDRAPFSALTWQQPWFRTPPPSPPEDLGWILGINDVRVHASDISTALVIPPESRIHKGTVVDRLYCSTRWQRELQEARAGLARNAVLQRLARQWRCNPADIEQAQHKLKAGYPLYGQTLSSGDLAQGECHALIIPLPDLSEDEDFVTAHQTPAWRELGDALTGRPRQVHGVVDQLIEVRRLKEIMVLRGFHRIDSEHPVRPDITGETDWLPALELYGEGIFFTLHEGLVAQWEQQDSLQQLAATLEQRAAPARPTALKSTVTPRFLLLHTLAHLFIRQLETAAGYPAASLKERIYCAEGKNPMSGILIYVAVPDEVGSLGGVGALATPARFLRLLLSAWETATWCSLDPVCSEQSGHGPELLNRAACHACVLIPEPCCPYGNSLLDRTFVKQDRKEGIRSLLDYAERPT